MSDLPPKHDLDDYDDGPLTPKENRQHRLIWEAYRLKAYSRAAWLLWLKVGTSVAAVGTFLIAVWTFVKHGAK